MPATFRRFGLAVLAFACLGLGACAHHARPRDGYAYNEPYNPGYGARYDSPYDNRYDSRYDRGSAVQYGRVSSIEQEYLRGRGERGTEGGGAVAGAIIGGVIGNQIGRGDDRGPRGRGRRGDDGGRAAATVIGAVGGALIGDAIERDSRRDEPRASVFHVRVRLDDRSEQGFDFERLDGLRVGDRVRIENGRLQRR